MAKSKHRVTVTVELALTDDEYEVIRRLSGFGAQTESDACADILMRHIRHHARSRRDGNAAERSIMPRPIPIDKTEGNARA